MLTILAILRVWTISGVFGGGLARGERGEEGKLLLKKRVGLVCAGPFAGSDCPVGGDAVTTLVALVGRRNV